MSGLAVVTGAAAGIGRAIARRFAAEGHGLVLVDLDPLLAETALELEDAGHQVLPVQIDLTDPAGRAAVVETVAGAGEELRVVVNNAGITRDARLVNMTEEAFDLVVSVNLGAAYLLTLELLPYFAEGSAVVSMSSRSYLGNFGQFNYSISKGGLVGMTRALAGELAPRVRANAVAPGLVGTEMVMKIPDEVRERMIAAVPMGRMGRPEEIAELVAYLASDAAGYVTGQVVVAGGGRSLR